MFPNMFPFLKHKKKKQSSRFMVYLVVGFLVYSLIVNVTRSFTSQKEASSGNQTSSINGSPNNTSDTEPFIDAKKIINLDVLSGKLLPKITLKLHSKDKVEGKGLSAICGQKVTINYSSFVYANNEQIENGNVSENSENYKEIEKDQKISFVIGEGKAMPALEKSVLGMKKNGKRSIFSPYELAYEAEGFSKENIPKDIPKAENILFDVNLVDISPALPDKGFFRVIGDGAGTENPYECGGAAKLHVAIWDVEGKKLFDSKDNNGSPINFTIGKSEVFFGLEQGVFLMSAGMHRNLIVPPAFQKTLNGNEAKVKFPFPKNQTVLVDINAIP